MSMYNLEDGEIVLVTNSDFEEDMWYGPVNIAWELSRHHNVIVAMTFSGVSIHANGYGQPLGLFVVSATRDDAASALLTYSGLFYEKYNTKAEALRAHKKLVRILSNPQRRLFDITLLCVD